MERRRLGRTGFEVAAVGIGTRGVATDLWRDGDPGEARRALYHAVERGVDLIDTSPAWGAGDTERVVGDVVRDLRARDRAVVVTRVPLLGARESVEESLRRTRLDALPIALLGPWDDARLDDPAWPELRGALERLVREGKVQQWGVVPTEPDGGVRAVAEPVFAAVCVPYNIFDPRAAATLLPAAREHGAGVIACSPLAAGGLGGGLGATLEWRPGDARAELWPPARLAALAARLAALAEFAAEAPPAARSTDGGREVLERSERVRRGKDVEARTVAELALRFCLARDEIGAIAVGMRTRAHADFNLPVADGRRLSPALLEALVEHAWARDRS